MGRPRISIVPQVYISPDDDGYDAVKLLCCSQSILYPKYGSPVQCAKCGTAYIIPAEGVSQ